MLASDWLSDTFAHAQSEISKKSGKKEARARGDGPLQNFKSILYQN